VNGCRGRARVGRLPGRRPARLACALAVVLAGQAFATGAARADEGAGPEERPADAPAEEESAEPAPYRFWLGPRDSLQGLISITRTRERDPGGEVMRGLKLGLGPWAEIPGVGGLRAFGWLSARRGDEQRVIGAGVTAGYFMTYVGPFRIYPHAKIGLEHRRRAPHDGFGGLAGVGVEVAFWAGEHWQIAVTADRNFGFPSGTRNQVGIALRFGHEEVFWWMMDALGY
jgi:hypothetical protein